MRLNRSATLSHLTCIGILLAAVSPLACDKRPTPGTTAQPPDEPSPPFRNIQTATSYVGDEACTGCHADQASAYRRNAMARSFHRWTPDTRIETALDTPLYNAPTGFAYAVVEVDGALYQEERLVGPEGRRLHELRRRMDYVMGSGNVARSYFTEENGRLFQLPLTWYRDHGWDFSPGYEVDNPRFSRLMPDRCIACHGSYPEPIAFVEGKYAELPPGIGCERCHGPGALHVEERTAGVEADNSYDDTIVNPTHLPLARRLDVCEQCHVHTPVTVLREGRGAFDYLPSQPLRDHIAIFKLSGSIDIVSHADRLRQSACFIATRATAHPLECATCHDPHEPPPAREARNQPCQSCHPTRVLEATLAASTALGDHSPPGNCVACHMPRVEERTVPHGTFTEHWIRVIAPGSPPPRVEPAGDRPIEPYFGRDRTGPDAAVYRGMGEIVYATLAGDARALAQGAEMLDRALDAETQNGEAHFLLGVAYRQLRRTGDAIRALERSVRLDPDRPDRLHALAQAYESAARDPAAVERLYQRALAVQPALAWIRADYADFLQTEGRRADAEAAYRETLDERPGLAVAWFNYATLLASGGRLEGASDAFQQAVNLDPSLAEALAPLFHVRTAGDAIIGLRVLGSPLTTMPVRSRGPNAVRPTLASGAGDRGIRFVNVPRGAAVRIFTADGPVIRTLRTSEGSALTWDLRTEAGRPVGGGLYRVRVEGGAPQVFHIGVVRTHVR